MSKLGKMRNRAPESAAENRSGVAIEEDVTTIAEVKKA